MSLFECMINRCHTLNTSELTAPTVVKIGLVVDCIMLLSNKQSENASWVEVTNFVHMVTLGHPGLRLILGLVGWWPSG